MKGSLIILLALVGLVSAYNIPKPMRVLVKTLAGKTISVETQSDATIASVKSKISDLDGIPVSGQQLFFGGVVLEDTETLADYDIQDECVLHLHDAKTKEEEAKKYLEHLGDEKFKQLFGDVDLEDMIFHPSHDDAKNSGDNFAPNDLEALKQIGKETLKQILSKLFQMFINSRLGR